jgi:plastocyanin
MKKVLFIASVLISVLSFSQNQSITISHSGLSPSSVLTVNAGELIDFIHGGGGSHPMTEGWGVTESSTPSDFITRTVTSSNPLVTFSIDIPGTYYFHCGTNPGNTNNWGKIIVLEENTSSVDENETKEFSVYPNPVTKNLILKGFNVDAQLYNINGLKVMDITTPIVNIESLVKGTYIVVSGNNRSIIIKK